MYTVLFFLVDGSCEIVCTECLADAIDALFPEERERLAGYTVLDGMFPESVQEAGIVLP